MRKSLLQTLKMVDTSKQSPLKSTPKRVLKSIKFFLIIEIALISVSSSLAQNPIIARYLFDGNNADSSGRAAVAENFGAVATTDRLGNANYAMSFDGSASYLNIPVHNLPLSNNPRSMSIWFKTNYYGADYRCMIAYGSAAGGKPIFPIFLRYGKVFYESGSSSDALYSKTEVNDNNWHMATVTYNGNKVILYVDGVANDSVSTTIITDPSAVWVGKCVWENRFCFNGALDEPSIYNKALTKTEVEQLYSENIPTDGLIAHYKLNDNLNNSQPIKATFENVKYTVDRFGNLNKAIQFNGNGSSYASFYTPELPTGKKPRTVSLWFKTNNKPTTTTIIWAYGQAVAGTPIFPVLLNTDGKLYFESGWSNNVILSKQSVIDNRWHHAVIAYDSVKVRLYLDGIAQDSVSVELQTQSSNIEAGRCVWTGNNAFNGSIDDIHFYNKSLKPSQADSLFKIGGMLAYQDLPVTEVRINTPNQSIVAGKQLQVNAQILPIYTINQKKVWESNDTQLAKVDTNGFVITSWNKSGLVKIICKSHSDNTKADTLLLNITAQTAKPDSGLVAYYPLRGNAKDSTANHFDGTTYNGLTYKVDRFGNPNKAANFDGIDDFIEANINLSTFANDWTLSAWFSKKENVTWSGIVSNNVGVYSCPLITSINNSNNIGINNSGVNDTNISSDLGTTHLDKWVFSTISYSKENNNITMVIYAPDSTYRVTKEVPWKLKFSDKIYIGRHFSGGVQIHKGSISDVRIYNRSLNETEIDTLFRRNGWLPYADIPVTSVEIKNPDMNIIAGKSIAAEAFVYPFNAKNRGIQWKSMDETKATVNPNGLISTNWRASGEVKIVCQSISDNTKTDTLKLNIIALTTNLEDGLLMNYPFNGNANDESQYNNDGIVKGAKLTYDRFGNPNKAYNFDGNDVIVVESSNHPTGNVKATYCFWFKSKADNTGRNIINVGDLATNKRSGVVVSGGGNLFYVAHYNDCGFNAPQPLNRWVFAVMTKSNDTLSLYINGSYVGYNKINPGQNLTNTKFTIGGNGDYWYGGEFFNGSIDDIRVYNRLLNEKEIDWLYKENNWADYSAIDPTDVKIINTETNIVASDRLKMEAQVYPTNTTTNSIWWKSLNKQIATIDSLSGNLSTTKNLTGLVQIVCTIHDFNIADTITLNIVPESIKLKSALIYNLLLNGNGNDTSGNSNHGNIIGATTAQNRFNQTNKAYEFNGTDQYIEMPGSTTTDLQEFSFTCWIKTTENRSNGTYWNRPCIFGNSNGGSPDADFGIITNGGKIGIWSGLNSAGDNEIVSTTSINDNQWHFITCTYNEDSIKLYVDGIDINCRLKANQRLNSHGYWIMAQHYFTGGASFHHQGIIDDIRLYGRPLYPSEITALFNEGDCSKFDVNAGTDISTCTGNQVMLNATGSADSYTWLDGFQNGIKFRPENTRTYIVTGTNNYCTKNDTIQIIVNPLPTVDAGNDVQVCNKSTLTLKGNGNAATFNWSDGVQDGVPFVPTANNSYILIGVSALGCINMDTVSVNINPLPLVNGGNDIEVCNGEKIVLKATGTALNYTWTEGVADGVQFTPSLSKDYIVTGNNSFGCINSDTVKVTINPLPTVNAGLDQTVTASSYVVLTATGNAVRYDWDNNVINGVPFKALETKDYVVTGYSTKMCSATDTVRITVTTNGVEEDLLQLVNIYPNPTSEWLTICMPNDEKLDISIIDINNKILGIHRNINSNEMFSVSELPHGMYILSIRTSSKTITRKILKN